MPTCAACGTAFQDGEVHTCPRAAATASGGSFASMFLATLAALVVTGALAAVAFTVYAKVTAPQPLRVDRAKLAPLYRSARAAQASIGMGLNLPAYSQLLQALATEVAVAKDLASTEPEKAIVSAYTAALASLHDANVIWTDKIDSAQYDFIPKGRVYVEGPIRAMVEKYKLPTQQHTGRNGPWLSIGGDESVQLVWARAGEQIDAATKLYLEG